MTPASRSQNRPVGDPCGESGEADHRQLVLERRPFLGHAGDAERPERRPRTPPLMGCPAQRTVAYPQHLARTPGRGAPFPPSQRTHRAIAGTLPPSLTGARSAGCRRGGPSGHQRLEPVPGITSKGRRATFEAILPDGDIGHKDVHGADATPLRQENQRVDLHLNTAPKS
jgi:hypothetical protein